MAGAQRGLEPRLREGVARIAFAEAAERRRIATGLHDQVGQLLVTARLRLGAVLADRSDTARFLTSVGELLDQAIWATRALTPSSWDRRCCTSSGSRRPCGAWALRSSASHGLRVQVAAEAGAAPLPDDLLDLLFRAARQLLMNALKHARAQRWTSASSASGRTFA